MDEQTPLDELNPWQQAADGLFQRFARAQADWERQASIEWEEQSAFQAMQSAPKNTLAQSAIRMVRKAQHYGQMGFDQADWDRNSVYTFQAATELVGLGYQSFVTNPADLWLLVSQLRHKRLIHLVKDELKHAVNHVGLREIHQVHDDWRGFRAFGAAWLPHGDGLPDILPEGFRTGFAPGRALLNKKHDRDLLEIGSMHSEGWTPALRLLLFTGMELSVNRPAHVDFNKVPGGAFYRDGKIIGYAWQASKLKSHMRYVVQIGTMDTPQLEVGGDPRLWRMIDFGELGEDAAPVQKEIRANTFTAGPVMFRLVTRNQSFVFFTVYTAPGLDELVGEQYAREMRDVLEIFYCEFLSCEHRAYGGFRNPMGLRYEDAGRPLHMPEMAVISLAPELVVGDANMREAVRRHLAKVGATGYRIQGDVP